jgi:hypothetical protein
MADTSDTNETRDLRTERGDAALIAQYLHELSERHDGSGEREADDPDG